MENNRNVQLFSQNEPDFVKASMKDQKYSKAVVLKLECASESPGGLSVTPGSPHY